MMYVIDVGTVRIYGNSLLVERIAVLPLMNLLLLVLGMCI